MQSNGDFVLSGPEGTWDTETDGNPGAYVTLQTNGQLDVDSASGNVLWQTDSTTTAAPYLQLDYDGVLGVYDSAWNTLFQTFAGQSNGSQVFMATPSDAAASAAPQAQPDAGPPAGDGDYIYCKTSLAYPHYSEHEHRAGRSTVSSEARSECREWSGGVMVRRRGLPEITYNFSLFYDGNLVASPSKVNTSGSWRTNEAVGARCVPGTWSSDVVIEGTAPPGFETPKPDEHNAGPVIIEHCEPGHSPVIPTVS